ncbi:hypothetical protein BCON_0116g00320 [Botryotinia convoluta]|uniref:Uncharacterized protein n=1 Tax=Botryotinia convoluta TaxID=54673 RepID=A0A4Z1HXE3_9HELO|nr:hypothetical protein BCON_0116g00320 [Botryotinia convoluta]
MPFNSLKRVPVFAHVINVPFSLSQPVINITTISTQDLSVLHDYNLIYLCFESSVSEQNYQPLAQRICRELLTSPGRTPRTSSSEESPAPRHSSKISGNTPSAHKTGSNKTRAKRPERKLCKNDPDPLSFDDWLNEEARYRAENIPKNSLLVGGK